MAKVIRMVNFMKCKYDEYFIQKYNDASLSIEDKREFEKHLVNCEYCESIVSKDRTFLEFIKEDGNIGEVPIDSILSRIDLDRYKNSNRKYKFKSFVSRCIPSFKVAVPVLAVSIAIITIFLNPMLKKTLIEGALNWTDKNERFGLQGAREIITEEIDNKTVELKDDLLVGKLNEYGIGVSPWMTSYADNDKVFFRNYASMVGFKNGHIYRVADLISMHADHVQGSVVSEFKFNSNGDYVTIGNYNGEEGYPDEYKSNIYMLNTDSGKYRIIGEGDYAKITDFWSFNGRYYVFVGKNEISDIRLFDSEKDKLYEIENPGTEIQKIFVTDEGYISFYSSGNIYFLSGNNYEVEKKIEADIEPQFLDGRNKTAIAIQDGLLRRYDYDKNRVETISSDIEGKGDVLITDTDNMFFRDFRFLGFKYSNSIGIYDFKEDRLKSFSPIKLPSDGYISGFNVSTNGERVFFHEDFNICYFGKDGEDVLDSTNMSWTWMSDSRTVSVKWPVPVGLETTIGNINAGEFEIVTYDAVSKQSDVIFISSVKTIEGQEIIEQDYNKLFELELYSDKEIYKTTDKIKIWATLKYIGNNDQIRIWHGDPYISFHISDGKEFNSGGIFQDLLTSTILEKDKIYNFDYSKNGGYSEDDPKADYWREFYAQKDLYLEEGEYTVKVGGAFSLTEDTEKSKSNLSKKLKIKVVN